VDILQSSRHVRIEVNGLEIANTRAPHLLFETGLPVRTYIPKTDCRMDLWEPSDTMTACPYKVRHFQASHLLSRYTIDVFFDVNQGEAKYYDIVLSSGETIKDAIWWYPTTTLECASIRAFVAFYDEEVDVWVDGEKQERPSKRP
jgi:uncharacterized protein (DUF427 family)